MYGGGPGHRCQPRIHADHFRWLGARQPIQHSHPQHALRLGHVVPEQRDHIGMIDVGVGTWLAVGAEGLLQGLRGGRRAQPGVPVQMVGADPGMGDHRERVVLLGNSCPVV